MCMMDYCDGMVTMLSTSDPKARKPHRCSECRRVIAVGEKYHVDRYVFDGSMTAHKTCAHCMVAELDAGRPQDWQNRPGREWHGVTGQAKLRWEATPGAEGAV